MEIQEFIGHHRLIRGARRTTTHSEPRNKSALLRTIKQEVDCASNVSEIIQYVACQKKRLEDPLWAS